MTYFIYGVLGMLFTVALFAGGVFLGWHLRIRYTKKTQAVVREELTEQQKREAKEAAQAFDTLVNYNPEMAYGLNKTRLYEASSDEE